VLNAQMPRRALPVVLAVAGAALVAPASGAAAIVEVGKVATEHAPSCPSTPCLAVSRTTGYQAKVVADRGLSVVPQDGKIVAWSITLGRPGRRQTRFFEEMLGGEAAARITILRSGRRLFSRVTGQSPLQKLEPYFGQTVQFALGRALNVRKGYVVALTVPTWAPALAVGLGNDSSWRASRPRDDCQDTQSQTAQQRLGALAQYRCLYRTARLTYSATLITRPRPTPPA
jgi:hypothetical protein